jgi:hypothetical protein
MKYATTTDGTRRDFRLIKGDTPLDPCKGIPVHVRGLLANAVWCPRPRPITNCADTTCVRGPVCVCVHP